MKKKPTNKILHDNSTQQRIADTIVKKITAMQSRWAVFMQTNTARLPKRLQQLIFIVIVFSSTCYSLFLIVSGLTGKQETVFHIDFIHFPQPAARKPQATPLITEMDFKKIDAFRLYVDSLQKTLAGKQIADSILAARPGLMDSIQQLTVLYHSLKK